MHVSGGPLTNRHVPLRCIVGRRMLELDDNALTDELCHGHSGQPAAVATVPSTGTAIC